MGRIFQCNDCETNLHTRLWGLLGSSSWSGDWFMVKNSVWRASQRKGACRFLCVSCLEDRIGRDKREAMIFADKQAQPVGQLEFLDLARHHGRGRDG